ncbi:MAG: peptide/nickel transport system substrate-binding protein [Thermomicrobiales bacterium]|nr:peptide/nickel transport system substrate-binding protein [Thermomicrobiales bacterium]
MSANACGDPRSLVVGYNGSVSSFTFSPLQIRPRSGVTRWMYGSLLRFEDDLSLHGDVVRDWEVSDDGRSYLFHLRPNVFWHDGEQLTADDVVFTGELLQQPQRYFRNTLFVGDEPVRFQKVDDLTVRIEVPQRYVSLPAYLTPVWGALFLLIPEHRLRNGDEENFARHPIGTGPFKFGGIDDDGNLTLHANSRYFGGRPQVDRVYVRFFASNEARCEAFERGELDVLIAPGRRYTDEDARRAGGRLYETRTNTTVHFAMNCRHPLFQSARVRQAVALAVDRVQMVQEIEGPEGVPAFSPVGPVCWAHEPDVERYPHDPGRAEELLREEGWRRDENGLLSRNGEPFRFSVIFPPDPWNFDLAGYARRIQEYLRKVGIQMEIRPSDYWSVIKPAWREQSFEAFLFYDTFYVEPDLYWSWHSSMPKRPEGPDDPAGLPQYGYGVTGYANATVDGLIERYRREPDQTRRKELLAQVQQIMAEEVGSLWLYNHPGKNVVHDRVEGLSRPSVADGTADLVALLHPERLAKRSASQGT